MARFMAVCLHSVGVDMPRVYGVVPLLDWDSVVEALTKVTGRWERCFVLSRYDSHTGCCVLHI